VINDEVFDGRPKIRLNVLNRLPKNSEDGNGRFPSWLHCRLPKGSELFNTEMGVQKYRLNTVCEEAKCPNRYHCYANKTATFLALGSVCTRNCGFCSIGFSKEPPPLEEDEPDRIASFVHDLGLKHVVITMVARDDLYDGGACHIAKIVQIVREKNPGCSIEVLTSDFQGDEASIAVVVNSCPEIFNYNIETVRTLTPRVRHKATYDRTLSVLAYVKGLQKVDFIKSGMMVGLGESKEEVFQTLRDLKQVGCDIVTIGQYLQSDRRKLLVKSFVTPGEFKEYEEYGYSLGIKQMYCGPFVRSSFNAGEVILSAKGKG
jgi:lipoyl synthase